MIWGAIPVPGLEQEAWGGLPGKVTEREGGFELMPRQLSCIGVFLKSPGPFCCPLRVSSDNWGEETAKSCQTIAVLLCHGIHLYSCGNQDLCKIVLMVSISDTELPVSLSQKNSTVNSWWVPQVAPMNFLLHSQVSKQIPFPNMDNFY